MYHAGGLTVFMTPLFAIGGSIVLHDGFDPAQLLHAFGEYRCTILFGVPTIFKMLFDAPGFGSLDNRRPRWCCSGGAPLPLEILRAYQERGYVFRQGYGLTEAGVNCFAMSDEDSIRKPGSIGKAMMFSEAKIVEANDEAAGTDVVGELWLRGPHVCKGYWNNPSATSQALDALGWFHTGDLARCDAEGFFYIAGRSKDMIISGGVNIYPAEIEMELLDHSGVAEVSVIGVGDEKWGEIPVAFVALKPAARASEEELIEFLRPRINKIKLPRQVIIVETLPRNAYGKVLKLDLKERLRHLKFGASGEADSSPEGRKTS